MQSVVVWSFCNEYECEQNDAGYSADAFRAAALSVDPTRPLTANHYGDEGLSARLDVQVMPPLRVSRRANALPRSPLCKTPAAQQPAEIGLYATAVVAADAAATRACTRHHTTAAALARNVPPPPLSRVSSQGFSHKKNDSFAKFHSDSPTTPAVLSECCSCIADANQRLGGTRGLPECIAQENTPGLLPYVSGSLGVW